MKKRLIEDSIECNFMDSPHSKDPVYHSHTKYEMLLILNDNISMLINGQKYDVPFGTLVLLTNHDLHLVTNNNGNNKMFKRIAIHFSPDLIRTYSTQIRICLHVSIIVPAISTVCSHWAMTISVLSSSLPRNFVLIGNLNVMVKMCSLLPI